MSSSTNPFNPTTSTALYHPQPTHHHLALHPPHPTPTPGSPFSLSSSSSPEIQALPPNSYLPARATYLPYQNHPFPQELEYPQYNPEPEPPLSAYLPYSNPTLTTQSSLFSQPSNSPAAPPPAPTHSFLLPLSTTALPTRAPLVLPTAGGGVKPFPEGYLRGRPRLTGGEERRVEGLEQGSVGTGNGKGGKVEGEKTKHQKYYIPRRPSKPRNENETKQGKGKGKEGGMEGGKSSGLRGRGRVGYLTTLGGVWGEGVEMGPMSGSVVEQKGSAREMPEGRNGDGGVVGDVGPSAASPEEVTIPLTSLLPPPPTASSSSTSFTPSTVPTTPAPSSHLPQGEEYYQGMIAGVLWAQGVGRRQLGQAEEFARTGVVAPLPVPALAVGGVGSGGSGTEEQGEKGASMGDGSQDERRGNGMWDTRTLYAQQPEYHLAPALSLPSLPAPAPSPFITLPSPLPSLSEESSPPSTTDRLANTQGALLVGLQNPFMNNTGPAPKRLEGRRKRALPSAVVVTAVAGVGAGEGAEGSTGDNPPTTPNQARRPSVPCPSILPYTSIKTPLLASKQPIQPPNLVTQQIACAIKPPAQIPREMRRSKAPIFEAIGWGAEEVARHAKMLGPGGYGEEEGSGEAVQVERQEEEVVVVVKKKKSHKKGGGEGKGGNKGAAVKKKEVWKGPFQQAMTQHPTPPIMIATTLSSLSRRSSASGSSFQSQQPQSSSYVYSAPSIGTCPDTPPLQTVAQPVQYHPNPKLPTRGTTAQYSQGVRKVARKGQLPRLTDIAAVVRYQDQQQGVLPSEPLANFVAPIPVMEMDVRDRYGKKVRKKYDQPWSRQPLMRSEEDLQQAGGMVVDTVVEDEKRGNDLPSSGDNWSTQPMMREEPGLEPTVDEREKQDEAENGGDEEYLMGESEMGESGFDETGGTSVGRDGTETIILGNGLMSRRPSQADFHSDNLMMDPMGQYNLQQPNMMLQPPTFGIPLQWEPPITPYSYQMGMQNPISSPYLNLNNDQPLQMNYQTPYTYGELNYQPDPASKDLFWEQQQSYVPCSEPQMSSALAYPTPLARNPAPTLAMAYIGPQLRK